MVSCGQDQGSNAGFDLRGHSKSRWERAASAFRARTEDSAFQAASTRHPQASTCAAPVPGWEPTSSSPACHSGVRMLSCERASDGTPLLWASSWDQHPFPKSLPMTTPYKDYSQAPGSTTEKLARAGTGCWSEWVDGGLDHSHRRGRPRSLEVMLWKILRVTTVGEQGAKAPAGEAEQQRALPTSILCPEIRLSQLGLGSSKTGPVQGWAVLPAVLGNSVRWLSSHVVPASPRLKRGW